MRFNFKLDRATMKGLIFVFLMAVAIIGIFEWRASGREPLLKKLRQMYGIALSTRVKLLNILILQRKQRKNPILHDKRLLDVLRFQRNIDYKIIRQTFAAQRSVRDKWCSSTKI
ncbi:hypothetical protein B9Z55_015589 [Caenorhabditis nigoni]|uniref:Uncharacterized protein n=1 Tax=Caenorhabditis nigoni TaxID=1611254 RepID=A0A2G5UAV3_9PELO|nr:hypothetical protein B9Z55_015589 [Caenorhabditis nigoni]